MAELLARADEAGLPCRLTIERTNAPSLAFVAQLGFAPVGGDELFLAFERPVGGPPR